MIELDTVHFLEAYSSGVQYSNTQFPVDEFRIGFSLGHSALIILSIFRERMRNNKDSIASLFLGK